MANRFTARMRHLVEEAKEAPTIAAVDLELGTTMLREIAAYGIAADVMSADLSRNSSRSWRVQQEDAPHGDGVVTCLDALRELKTALGCSGPEWAEEVAEFSKLARHALGVFKDAPHQQLDKLLRVIEPQALAL